jgi:hypothetical protein
LSLGNSSIYDYYNRNSQLNYTNAVLPSTCRAGNVYRYSRPLKKWTSTSPSLPLHVLCQDSLGASAPAWPYSFYNQSMRSLDLPGTITFTRFRLNINFQTDCPLRCSEFGLGCYQYRFYFNNGTCLNYMSYDDSKLPQPKLSL